MDSRILHETFEPVIGKKLLDVEFRTDGIVEFKFEENVNIQVRSYKNDATAGVCVEVVVPTVKQIII